MAKNLFEQLLTKASEIWSGPKTYGEHDIYIKDSSGLSGVAKYLAKQEEAAKAKEAETLAAQATGVEKYLARQQSSSPQTVEHSPATGVEKYLARQTSGRPAPAAIETVAAPATGVGKYLSRQASPSSIPPKEPVVVPKTGVGKYLAGVPISRGTTAAAPAPEKKQPPQQKPETKKTSAPAKKTASSTTTKEVPPAAASKVQATEPTAGASAPGHDVIHFENVTQCQSRTVKGTQCKNTNHLTKLQRTINKQKYLFSACPQHHNDTFKPYPPLLETH